MYTRTFAYILELYEKNGSLKNQVSGLKLLVGIDMIKERIKAKEISPNAVSLVIGIVLGIAVEAGYMTNQECDNVAEQDKEENEAYAREYYLSQT